MIDKEQVQVGTLLKLYKLYNAWEESYALVIDTDDNQINHRLFHLLIGDKTSWEYIRDIDGEIIK